MKEKIHHIHLAILVYMLQTGIILFHLPRITAQAYGTNGWIAVLIYSIVALLNILLIAKVYSLIKGRSIFEILDSVFSKWILIPFYLFLCFNWTFLGALIANQYVNLLQIVSFPATPQYYLVLLVLYVTYLFITKEPYVMAKASTILFFLTIWVIPMVLFLLPDFSLVRFSPFIFKGETSFIEGGFEIYSAFLGFELILFLFPYIDQKTKFKQAVIVGHLITTFAYLFICLTAYSFYSFEHVKKISYPVIDMLSYIQLPFIERIESLVFAFFIMKVVVTIGFFLWSALETTQQIFPNLQSSFLGLLIIIAGFLITLIPMTIRELNEWLSILVYIEIGIATVLPVVLLMILIFKRQKMENSHYG